MAKTTDLNLKLIHSGFWFTISTSITTILTTIQTFILGKFLTEYQFGLYSLVFLFQTLFEAFSQIGVRDALIQSKVNNEDMLHTAFWMEVIRGILMYTIIIPLSFILSSVYHENYLKILLLVFSTKFVFNGLKNIKLIQLYKDFNTKRLVFIQQIPMIITSIAMMISAYQYSNILLIVCIQVIGEVFSLIFSYLAYPFNIKLSFHLKYAKELLSFGKHIFILSILAFFLRQIDYLFISKFISIEALGLYTLAYKITNLPVTNLVYVISNITFPLYSKFQDRNEIIYKYFNLFNRMILYVVIPFALIILFDGQYLLNLLFKDKWNGLYLLVASLLIFSAIRTSCAMLGSVFKAKGRVDIDNKMSVIELSILVILIYPCYHLYRLYGVVIAITIAIFVRYIISILELYKMLSVTGFITNLLKPFGMFVLSMLINMLLNIVIIKETLFIVVGKIVIYLGLFTVLLFFVEKENIITFKNIYYEK